MVREVEDELAAVDAGQAVGMQLDKDGNDPVEAEQPAEGGAAGQEADVTMEGEEAEDSGRAQAPEEGAGMEVEEAVSGAARVPARAASALGGGGSTVQAVPSGSSGAAGSGWPDQQGGQEAAGQRERRSHGAEGGRSGDAHGLASAAAGRACPEAAVEAASRMGMGCGLAVRMAHVRPHNT